MLNNLSKAVGLLYTPTCTVKKSPFTASTCLAGAAVGSL